MKVKQRILGFLLFLLTISVMAGYAISVPQDDLTRRQNNRQQSNRPQNGRPQDNRPQDNRPQTNRRQNGANAQRAGDDTKNSPDDKKKTDVKAQPILETNEEIPDSLLHPRWKIQRTQPITDDDLRQGSTDLARPENMKQSVVYNDTLDRYIFGNKIAGTYVWAPTMMNYDEYFKWSERQALYQFFKSKSEEAVKNKGKDKFDFTDMHFDLGPAEKIFGPGGVRIKTSGTAELKFGATLKNIDNPSLPIRNRKTTTMDFDEKINLSVNGKVGDKVNMNLNYNTDATFNFDSQSLKLKYEGKEDEIIKLVEGGNVSFPSNSRLITGASSLFGLRTDMQFGKLKLQTVISQKKSSSSSVSSKGGVQLTAFEIDAANYEENRHFFLAKYFRDRYDDVMKTLPTPATGVEINRIEIWVTNKTGSTTNTRNIIALPQLGESGSPMPPSNNANSLYSDMVGAYAAARDIDQTSTVLDPHMVGGVDYEKIESARLLNSSEYTINGPMGYVSLKTALQTDQVLAVAFEYNYGGVTYQVGEFASDITDVNKCLIVKSLKNTSNNPQQSNWDLMMKNVYYLASSVQKDRFRLDIKFQSDTAGVYLTYIPEPQVKSQTIIKDIDADRLDDNNKVHSNGYFDFIEGYTVSNGRVFLPKAEPFGEYLYNFLVSNGVAPATAEKYSYTELYDSTKTVAKQIAEKDKYILMGQYRGTSANVISLGASNVPQGSVVVTAGGVTLSEGSDYTVDYSAGEVTILNQSIIDAGTAINVSLESNTDYGQSRKTMFGVNWEYDFSKNFQLSGTLRHLSEQALTTKVAMGAEPLNNTLWGVNLNWKKESQWLTNMLNMIPFLHVTRPSQISLTAEFAHLIAGQARGTQDNASYLDDFENTKNSIDVSSPTSWVISSVPTMFDEYKDKTGLSSGYNRSLLAWYNVDPLFTRRSSSLTPSHIKSDLDQLSNHYVREVYVRELYPNRDQSSYSGATSTLPVLNLAFYPAERGPYNFNPNLNSQGRFEQLQNKWGGMMRKLDTNDFEAANIEYIEFWMLDPFIYSHEQTDAGEYGGDFYINLGEVSEDILRDGKKFYESGMPVDGSNAYNFTQWGKVPTQSTVTYAFATTAGSRAMQDVGYNGLTDTEEQTFTAYQDFLTSIQGKVAPEVFDSIWADPANDDYHYFRGSDFDERQASILQRYKKINNPQGNTPDSDMRPENYDTSYKTTPDVEDINQDYTLNEYEKYYQYHVSIRPEDMVVGHNFIVDSRIGSGTLRNGERYEVTWYQFRIPLDRYERREGSISDFSSVRFMRMFLTNFSKPIVLRFGSLDLVRGEWRVYNQNLSTTTSNSGYMSVSAVNIEENNDKVPVNYILPPGISRVQDPTQPQLVENNEQALNIVVNELSTGESKCVYKNTTQDLRHYRRLQMFVHANAMNENVTNLTDNQLAVFIRLGSDYKSNYYEYEIPLKLTPPGHYDKYSYSDKVIVWPEENMVDIPLSIFTSLKKERNLRKALGQASYNQLFTAYDEDKPANKVSIMGNPTLGEVKTMIVGVRNLSGDIKSGEVWVNELRLKEYNNEGGWAAQGALNVQLSDLGMVNVTGSYMSEGFGGLEDGVATRSQDDFQNFTLTTNLELGKFFPDKAKVSMPLYYSVTKEKTKPKYNPLDTDMRLDDALESSNEHERDSIESIAVTKVTNTNFSLSNMRVGIQTKGHPMPYDPANFSFSYSHLHNHTSGETTVYENEDKWDGSMNYSWTPVFKAWEPFKNLIKSKSKWWEIAKKFGINYLPQNISFNTQITRRYYELQRRDMENLEGAKLPLTFSQQFLWNRKFSLRWDLTKNLHMNFESGTNAEIEEPYTPVNKDLYPERYEAWKDSVWNSIKHFGDPLKYTQVFSSSYHVPLNLIPIFDWVNADLNYDATYNWDRGTELEDGSTMGNIISNNRTFKVNGTFNLQKLYDHIPFLKKTNERFNKTTSNKTTKKTNSSTAKKTSNKNKGKEEEDGKEADDKQKSKLPKNKNTFEKEITIKADTSIVVTHSKKSRRLLVSAKDKDGKIVPVKFKVVDDNKIKIINKSDSAVTLKLTVSPKQPLEEKSWYKTAQVVARALMMVRNVSISYRNQRAMSLPGFLPNIGATFGQHRGDILSPGLDFAFGLNDESYIDKARDNGWLLNSDRITSAATNFTRDLQLKMTLEPARDLKIDLNASHTQTDARKIQYGYLENSTTRSGQFNMTTISLKSSLEATGNATDGYHSASFERFCNSLEGFRSRVQAQYEGAVYPSNSTVAGEKFDPANGGVGLYSADVMIPAFLSSYTNIGGSSLKLFPAISAMLPNWSIRYSGLSKLSPFKDLFKSVNINHAYTSIFAIGSYASFSTWREYMGDLGFITDATTNMPVPSSMFNISTASINEQFKPLLGVDVTLNNNLTCKLEYRTVREVSLSTTSVQISERTSHDWVVGMGYKINNFRLFGGGGARKVKGNKNSGNKSDEDNSKNTSKNSRAKGGSSFNHDLNLRFDLSYRQQAAITRDIATLISQASSGNNAFKFSFIADYTLSKLMTMSFYYDQQTNTPLLSSNSYPTTTYDFGLSVKFSLTR